MKVLTEYIPKFDGLLIEIYYPENTLVRLKKELEVLYDQQFTHLSKEEREHVRRPPDLRNRTFYTVYHRYDLYDFVEVGHLHIRDDGACTFQTYNTDLKDHRLSLIEKHPIIRYLFDELLFIELGLTENTTARVLFYQADGEEKIIKEYGGTKER